ncbi:hypothetical protein TorRG33x02_283430 [Trema orientale]|uniref:Uncharacterized protein n=1 Tax=Trema orientale TaxID=63057 RepID=A0A2P5CIU4_TREOI|nr:hypothetical protein TorRG33x02_283430 [Trema orientale]
MFSSGTFESLSKRMNFRFTEKATSMAKEVANDLARSRLTGGKSEETIVMIVPSLSLTTTATTTVDGE